MRVQIVDPAAYTPPYDHALCAALARAGADVELITCHFPYGPVPQSSKSLAALPGQMEGSEDYRVTEMFYRASAASEGNPQLRRALRAAEHLPGMLRHRRHAREADVLHYQWLPIPRLDRHLLAPVHPRVFTMHWRLPQADSPIGRALTKLLARMDAVIVHTDHGAGRLERDFGVPAKRLWVIPHGAFDYLTAQAQEQPLPDELQQVDRPVVLAFGLVRPYKGTDLLIRAFAEIEDAELWVVGMPRMPMKPLRSLAENAAGRVRFIDRFVTDPEIPAYMRRADVVALPYRNIEQSGVLYTALAFGRPLLLSDVGGFGEIAAEGAARTVPSENPAALAAALRELLGDDAERERLAASAQAAARGRYSWDKIGRETMALYERLTK
ncbi:MAG TPA: glycosyltransferase family 4 protein [Solirubrobacterales bacterium]|jgi:glycosyltransferase involved in cell wall biosynthesis|nr:glycosyltransferase family 4 protein [Solirubrobacterales bacterium]